MKLDSVMTPDSANSLDTSPMRRMFSSRSSAAAGRRQSEWVGGAEVGEALWGQLYSSHSHRPCSSPKQRRWCCGRTKCSSL